MTDPDGVAPATVYLVGAGPGDPGLLTLRGAECLRRAEVVLYDYLANPSVLEHAAPSAELVPLGRTGTGRSLTPDEITDRMIEEARRGRTTVRLKGGDPSVFGRGADETGALRRAGIPFEVVPGITAGLALAAYCEIPVTHQDDASALALVVGRERDAKEESGLDYGALAAFPGTLIFYMGVARAALWSAALVARGKSPDTPVAIVRWCTRAAQEILRCTLGTVSDFVATQGVRPPALFVVGEVVRRAPARSWFAARALFGVRVLVPGSPATSWKLRTELGELGAEVVLEPAIRITGPPDPAAVDGALDALDRYDWLVFSSANGVDAFLGRLLERGHDVRALGGVRLAAMGSGTADRLARYHLRADLVPDEFVAEALAEALLNGPGGRRFLLVRADRGRDVLSRALRAGGAQVDEVPAYGSEDVREPDPGVAAALEAGDINWIAVTSSAVARSLARLYGSGLAQARIASIGPIASETLRGLGREPAVQAEPHTTSGLVEAILRAEQGGG
ncbi:MAG TPA: uroporphyrinogen-III C-methyltransferase [Longimicrobiales bacterium]|nr:uroporphyrinogen-III C-methyltransferase [Longimicrobiales bacterium]